MSRGTTLELSKEALKAQKSIAYHRNAWLEDQTIENLVALAEAKAYFAGISYGLAHAAEVASMAELGDWKKDLRRIKSRDGDKSPKED